MLVLSIRGKSENIEEEGAFDAMRRFYQAKKAGDTTSSLIRCLSVSDPSSALGPTEDLDEVTSLSMARQEQEILLKGIALPPPVYAPSTRLRKVGDNGFAIHRHAWDDSPEILPCLSTLRRLVRREERSEYTVKLGKVTMHNDGTIDFGYGPMYCEQGALKQLLQTTSVFPKGSSYLVEIESQLRAENWRKRSVRMAKDKLIKIRTRRNPLTGRFSVFSVVSPQYATMDIDELAAAIEPLFEEAPMRGSVVYDSETTNLRVDAHSEKIWCAKDIPADEFRTGIQLRTNDRGDGGVYLLGTVRLQRGQHQLPITHDSKAMYYTQHQGDMRRVKSEISEAMSLVHAHFDAFAEDWVRVRKTNIEEVFGEKKVHDIFSKAARRLDSGVMANTLAGQFVRNFEENRLFYGDKLVALVVSMIQSHTHPYIDQYHLENVESGVRDWMMDARHVLDSRYKP